jgi:RNA polymerase subunit RPABC4/transcription elongation factor Spt4
MQQKIVEKKNICPVCGVPLVIEKEKEIFIAFCEKDHSHFAKRLNLISDKHTGAADGKLFKFSESEGWHEKKKGGEKLWEKKKNWYKK